MDHKMRPAREADATDIARLYYLAGKSHAERSAYDLMIDGLEGMTDERVEVLSKWATAATVSWFSYRYYTVMDVDGHVASGLATFTVEQFSNRPAGKAIMEAGWSIQDMLAMTRRMTVWDKADPGKRDDYLIVEHVATFEPYRRNGFTSKLLEDAIRKGREGGFKGLQLEIMLGNTPAINAYEKAGFTLEKTIEDKEFAEYFTPAPGLGRMLLDY